MTGGVSCIDMLVSPDFFWFRTDFKNEVSFEYITAQRQRQVT